MDTVALLLGWFLGAFGVWFGYRQANKAALLHKESSRLRYEPSRTQPQTVTVPVAPVDSVLSFGETTGGRIRNARKEAQKKLHPENPDSVAVL